MKRRVVVTGMGAITPIGLSVGEFWDAVKQKKLGFAPITHFDASGYKCRLAAEVKGFDGKNYMDFKSAKRMELFSQYAMAASKEAIADAKLDLAQEDAYRAGCAISSGIGSLQAIEREHKKLLDKGPSRVNPLGRRKVPGNVLDLEVEIIKVKGPVGIGKGTAYADGKLAASAEMMFAIGSEAGSHVDQ